MIKMHMSHLGTQPRSTSSSLHRRPSQAPATQAQRPSVPLADALWTKNLRELAQKTTPEDLAVALDMPLPRLQELLQGVNFSQEMVYHLEVALKLSPGYFSQVNPKIPKETLEILANPSHRAEHSEDSLYAEEPPEATPSPSVSESSPVPTRETPSPSAPLSAAPLPVALPPARPMEASMTPSTSGSEDIFATRRSNLNLLTSVKGSKSALARLLGISAAVMSHRLHGLKKIHEDDTQQICNLLGLAPDWFEVPRSASDFPPDLSQRLAMAPPAALAAASPKAPGRRGRRKTEALAKPLSAEAGSSEQSSSGASVLQLRAQPAPSAPAAGVSKEESSVSRATAKLPGSAEQPVLIDEAMFAQARLQPIAEALVKVLIVRAQRGELTEAVALRMLTDMVGS